METTPTNPVPRRRVFAAGVSLAAGVAIFAAKLVAWRATGSAAVLSDALESTVNVVAAIFAVFALRYAAQPADRDHPYGHGKVEFLAAAFEGGLVAFAAVLILWSAAWSLWVGPSLRKLDLGLLVTAGAGAANLALGGWLVRTGRKLSSPTLVADGQHVLSDVWSTLGVLLGLALVRLTGIVWLDPVAALVVGLLLVRTGIGLVKEAVGGLLDREDPVLLAKLVEGFNEARVPGLSGIHRLRAIRSGGVIHVDAHVFVPNHWTVEEAHAAAHRLEDSLIGRTGLAGELALHLDPCRHEPCSTCDLTDCGDRRVPRAGGPLTLDEAVGPPPSAPGHVEKA
jgi:cation diffusion facilitator family transporter